MKLSFAVALLLGAVVAQEAESADAKKVADPEKGKDFFTNDPRRGTSDAPLLRAPLGSMAKPTKPFEVPKNKEAEPPLSTTMDPTDYESGSGKTYHDKKTAKVKDEKPKKPETPAGIEESTETAGTTKIWKVNAGDSPDPPKKKEAEAEITNAKLSNADKAEKIEKAEKEAKAEEKALEKAAEKAEEKAEKKAAEKEEAAEKPSKKPKSKEVEEAAPESKSFLQTEATAGCEPAIDVSQAQLDIELDYFSRKFDPKNYKKAMQIYKELKKQGKDPKVSIHTWELYDQAFSFPRVRRYDLVQKHMDLLQHFQDNLNENFTNRLHLDNFLRVANNARSALNEKYHNGEFSDPADFDPQEDHPVTWATA